MEGGHGGVVGEGGGLGGGQGQGGGVEAGREERRPDIGQERMGRDLPGPAGDERRETHTSTGGQGARLQGTVGQQRVGELGGDQGTAVTLEWLPDVGSHVAEGGEGTTNGGRESSCWTSSEPDSRGSVGTVGMTVGADLLLLPPLGPSVLEPDLEEEK